MKMGHIRNELQCRDGWLGSEQGAGARRFPVKPAVLPDPEAPARPGVGIGKSPLIRRTVSVFVYSELLGRFDEALPVPVVILPRIGRMAHTDTVKQIFVVDEARGDEVPWQGPLLAFELKVFKRNGIVGLSLK